MAKHPKGRYWTPQELSEAKALLEKGSSYYRAEQLTGINHRTLQMHFDPGFLRKLKKYRKSYRQRNLEKVRKYERDKYRKYRKMESYRLQRKRIRRRFYLKHKAKVLKKIREYLKTHPQIRKQSRKRVKIKELQRRERIKGLTIALKEQLLNAKS